MVVPTTAGRSPLKNEVEQMIDYETENIRLKNLVDELKLEKQVLVDVLEHAKRRIAKYVANQAGSPLARYCKLLKCRMSSVGK